MPWQNGKQAGNVWGRLRVYKTSSKRVCMLEEGGGGNKRINACKHRGPCAANKAIFVFCLLTLPLLAVPCFHSWPVGVQRAEMKRSETKKIKKLGPSSATPEGHRNARRASVEATGAGSTDPQTISHSRQCLIDQSFDRPHSKKSQDGDKDRSQTLLQIIAPFGPLGRAQLQRSTAQPTQQLREEKKVFLLTSAGSRRHTKFSWPDVAEPSCADHGRTPIIYPRA